MWVNQTCTNVRWRMEKDWLSFSVGNPVGLTNGTGLPDKSWHTLAIEVVDQIFTSGTVQAWVRGTVVNICGTEPMINKACCPAGHHCHFYSDALSLNWVSTTHFENGTCRFNLWAWSLDELQRASGQQPHEWLPRATCLPHSTGAGIAHNDYNDTKPRLTKTGGFKFSCFYVTLPFTWCLGVWNNRNIYFHSLSFLDTEMAGVVSSNIFFVVGKNPVIQHSRYNGCRWPGSLHRQVLT